MTITTPVSDLTFPPLQTHLGSVHTPPPAPGPFYAIEGPSLPPEGYSVAVLADGYYYPQRLTLGDLSVRFIRRATDPAQPLLFASYLDAIVYCWEEFLSEVQYEGSIERVMHCQEAYQYSDRVTEYQDFLEEVTGERAHFWSANGFATACVGPFLWSPRPFSLAARRETVEEALADVCEQVFALAHPLVEQAVDEEWKTWWEETAYDTIRG